MKRLLVTYHMTRPDETAETCIVLPMTDRRAELVLAEEAGGPSILGGLLNRLAAMQGYESAEFITAKEVKNEPDI